MSWTLVFCCGFSPRFLRWLHTQTSSKSTPIWVAVLCALCQQFTLGARVTSTPTTSNSMTNNPFFTDCPFPNHVCTHTTRKPRDPPTCHLVWDRWLMVKTCSWASLIPDFLPGLTSTQIPNTNPSFFFGPPVTQSDNLDPAQSVMHQLTHRCANMPHPEYAHPGKAEGLPLPQDVYEATLALSNGSLASLFTWLSWRFKKKRTFGHTLKCWSDTHPLSAVPLHIKRGRLSHWRLIWATFITCVLSMLSM